MTKSEFIEKSRVAHGDKYIYDKVQDEVKAKDDVTIICPMHGEFTQNARSHYRGHGCSKCKAEITKNALSLTTDVFRKKYHNKFGNKYDTSLVDYNGFETKVVMICPKHGEFEKTPHELMRGEGCPICGNERSAESHRLSREEVIDRANKVHNFKYNYDKYNGEKLSEEVTITCPIHGDFKQTMRKHLMGSGCRKCGYEKLSELQREPFNKVLKRCKEIHNNKYEYVIDGDFEYKNRNSILNILCSKHGIFKRRISEHLNGCGCPKCAHEELLSRETHSTDWFIKKAKSIHGDTYIYDKTIYKRSKKPVIITCRKHGDFEQLPNFHLMGSGCPKCSHPISRWENEVYEFINSLGIECEQSNRSILNGKEIDIFIPKFNIGIECDGLRWHSELYRDMDYHLSKTNECERNGIRLIHIFEDEWILKNRIWKSILRNSFGLTEEKIYARKCIIKEVSNEEAKIFLDNNHLQGYSASKINYGLYYKNELVSIMTFIEKDTGVYEIVRYCCKLNSNVIGGASKLFKYFIKTVNSNEIISYCDKRWSLGNLYNTLGFVHIHDLKPIMLERGFYRIYDCGSMVWQWQNKTKE